MMRIRFRECKVISVNRDTISPTPTIIFQPLGIFYLILLLLTMKNKEHGSVVKFVRTLCSKHNFSIVQQSLNSTTPKNNRAVVNNKCGQTFRF